MKKGFKKKMSMILIMAMVISLSMPVSAKENRSAFDETIITEEPGSDSTVIEEELSPDRLEAPGSVDIDTESDAVESDAEGETTTPTLPDGWAIYRSNGGQAVAGTDYTYSNNTVTIIRNTNTADGLEITVRSHVAGAIPTLTWDSSSNGSTPVPVTLDWTGYDDRGAAINVIAPESAVGKSIIKAGRSTWVAKQIQDGDYQYTDNNRDISEPSGSYQVYISEARVSGLSTDDVTIGNSISGKPTLNFDQNCGQVIAAAISSSDVGPNSRIYRNNDAWHATGWGNSLIIFSSNNSLSMKTLRYEACELNVDEDTPKETLTVNPSGSSSISGTISNMKSASRYQIAAFTADKKIVANSSSEIDTSESDGSANFTINGLTANTSYRVGARVIKSTSGYGSRYSNTLYIPSDWIYSDSVTLHSATYNITYGGLEGSSFENNNPNPSTYTVGGDSIILQNPTKPGYEFKGWFAGTSSAYNSEKETNIVVKINPATAVQTGNLTYTAIFEELSYNIEYDLQGGSWSGGEGPSTYKSSVGYTISQTPQRDYYSFAGWKEAGSSGVPASTITVAENTASGNKSYTAVWTPVPYTITYAGLDDSSFASTNPNPSSYTVETPTFTLQNPTKEGKEFAGWTIGEAAADTAKPLIEVTKGSHGAVTYTAQWADKVLSGSVVIAPYNNANDYGFNFVYGQQLKATVYDADGNEITSGLSYQWYTVNNSNTPTLIEGATSATYIIGKPETLNQYNLACVVSATGMTGTLSATTPTIRRRPLRVVKNGNATKVYTPGNRDVTISFDGVSDYWAQGDLLAGDSVCISNLVSEFFDEYVGSNKPIKNVDFATIGVGEGHDYDPQYYKVQFAESMSGFTGSITTKNDADITAANLYVSQGGTLTENQLESAVSGELGRTLTFTIAEESAGSMLGGNYVAPQNLTLGTATLNVYAAPLDINGDGEYEYSAEETTLTVTFNSLNTPQLEWNDDNHLISNGVVTGKQVGDSFTITAINNTSSVSSVTITYSPSDADIATVDGSGSVEIKKLGTVEITASATGESGVSNPASISYTINVAPKVVDSQKLPVITNLISPYTGNPITGITYTASSQSPGYKLKESTYTSGSDAHIYEATFILENGYRWPVGTQYQDEINSVTIDQYNNAYPITLRWKITKQTCSQTLSSNDFQITPATSGVSDGVIKYVGGAINMSELEYTTASDPSDNDWQKLTTGVTTYSNLHAGTYKIRYGETVTTLAGSILTLTIPSAHVVSFETARGTAPVSQKVVMNGYAEVPEAPTDPSGLYTFDGWYPTASGDDGVKWDFTTDKVTQDMVLYARWSGKTVEFTYSLEGGELPANYPTGYTVGGDMVKIVNPTRSGYLFTGWTASGDLAISNAQANVTVDPATLSSHYGITFTAHWKERLAVPMAILQEKQGSELVPIEGTTFDADTAYVLLDILSGYPISTWTIYYTIGDTMPTMDSQTFTKEFAITDTTKINAFVVDPSGTYADSEIVTYTFTKYSSAPVSTPITGIKVSPETISVDKGKTATLTASFLPAYANENATITWTSSDTSIATVSESGTSATVTGVETGTATITASVTAKGGTFTATCEVTVEEKVEITGITVAPATATLMKAKNLNLTAALVPVDTTENATITWTSSDTSIATVSESGTSATVTGIKVGTATITASVTNRSGQTFSNEAKINVIDDILYNPKVSWTVKFPNSFTKGSAAPELQYTVTYTFANTGETKTSDPIKVTATSTNNFSAGSTDKEVTFTAVADLTGYFEDKEGTKSAKNVELTKTYRFIEVNGGGFTLVGLAKEYPYTGAAIKPAFEVMDNVSGKTLANGVDYSVTYSKNTKIGQATIKVKGKGNYDKSNADATFMIVDPKKGVEEAGLADLDHAKIDTVTPKAFEYDGEPHYPETITMKLQGGSYVTYTGVDGKNYVDPDGNKLPAVVSFSGNVNAGTATLLLSGKNNGNGKATTVKKTFKIDPVDLKKASDGDLSVTVLEDTVEWEAKGAKPAVKVEYKGRVLLEGEDYKLSYKNNKRIGKASVILNGKGNYKNTRKNAASFTIEQFDLDQAEIIATNVSIGKKISQGKVTILDKAGNPIPSSKYTVRIEGAGDMKLAAGEEVNITVEAKGVEVKGICSTTVSVWADLNKAKVKVKCSKTYTGEPIELTEEDMGKVTVQLKNEVLEYNKDFVIAGYTNNVKKGKMTVTIVGISEKCSGSRTFTVKIQPKPIGDK